MQKVRHSGIETKRIGEYDVTTYLIPIGDDVAFEIEHIKHGSYVCVTHEEARELKSFLDDYFLKLEVVNANT